MADALVIQMAQARKSYGPVEALRGFDLAVPRGAICGFLGRNGAGKTTAMKTLLGMSRLDGGEARVFDLRAGDARDSVEIRRRAAFVSEDKQLYPSWTVERMIRFTASFFPGWRADLERRYLQQFALPVGRPIKTLSNGMRSKLALLLALCRGAELLLLDEPTAGLDPVAAEEVLQALVGLETTILFSSHQVAEIEQIADRVSIIDGGREVVAGDLDEVRERFCRVDLVFAGAAPESFHAAGVERVRRNGRVLTVFSSAGPDAIVDEARAHDPVSIDVAPMGLKEIFLEKVG